MLTHLMLHSRLTPLVWWAMDKLGQLDEWLDLMDEVVEAEDE